MNELEKQMVDDIILKVLHSSSNTYHKFTGCWQGYFEPDEVDSGEANATAEGVKEEDQGVKKEDLGVKEDQEKYQREEEERMQFLKEAELEEMKEKNPKEEEARLICAALCTELDRGGASYGWGHHRGSTMVRRGHCAGGALSGGDSVEPRLVPHLVIISSSMVQVNATAMSLIQAQLDALRRQVHNGNVTCTAYVWAAVMK